MEGWHFAAAMPNDRVTELRSWRSFDDIVSALLQGFVGALWWEPFSAPRLRGCNRASFPLRVGLRVYDAFFNSPNGYRAQYAISPTDGAAANRKLISALEPLLLAATDKQRTVDPELVRASLHGMDAKVWISELEVEDQLSDPNPSIAFAQWEFRSPNGQGLRAPVGSLLEVKGGWLNAAGIEIRDPTKANRDRDLYESGFT